RARSPSEKSPRSSSTMPVLLDLHSCGRCSCSVPPRGRPHSAIAPNAANTQPVKERQMKSASALLDAYLNNVTTPKVSASQSAENGKIKLLHETLDTLAASQAFSKD